MPDSKHEYEDAHGLDGPNGEAGEVVYVGGAACDTGVGEPDHYRVVGEVPQERRCRAAHAEATAEHSECAEAPRDDGTHAPCEREGEKRADDPVWHFPCSEDSNEPGKTEPFGGFALVCKDSGWKAVEVWFSCLAAQGVAGVGGGAKEG